MKITQKASTESIEDSGEKFKSIDSYFVPVNTVKLSARTRTQQQKTVPTSKISIEQLRESLSKLAEPKLSYQQPENTNWKIPKRVLKYKASQRIQHLAKPRQVVPKVMDRISPQNSFQSTVSTNALKYVPTPRILELARPRQYEVEPEETAFWDIEDLH